LRCLWSKAARAKHTPRAHARLHQTAGTTHAPPQDSQSTLRCPQRRVEVTPWDHLSPLNKKGHTIRTHPLFPLVRRMCVAWPEYRR
jgi:hypothetical protein